MVKRSLPLASEATEGLGLRTAMDPELARQLGAPYVRLLAFAIDMDRVRVATETEGVDDGWPFGWELFLTERAAIAALVPLGPELVDVADLICQSIFSKSAEGPTLGAGLTFALFDAVGRGQLPAELRPTFLHWKRPPKDVVELLAPFWEDEAAQAKTLAEAVLAVELDPPLAPTSIELLRLWR